MKNNDINSSVTESYIISIAATTTNPTPGTSTSVASYYRVGKMLYIKYFFNQTTAGTSGTGTYLFNIPSGLTIDTTITPVYANIYNFSNLGPVLLYGSSSPVICCFGCCTPYNSTQIAFIAFSINETTGVVNSGSALISDLFFGLNTTPLTYTAYMEIPIN
jgi:hypothetical protein